MSPSEPQAPRSGQVLNRFHARLAARARPATGFVYHPEPHSIGNPARGGQLLAGNFLFAGTLVTTRDTPIWDIETPDQAFADALQGFGWLDDLAALGDMPARVTAQDWVQQWIARFGDASGVGWEPELAGRRLIRWISHAVFLLRAQEREASEAFFLSLGQQTIYLSRRWRKAPQGLPRLEALVGLLYAGLSLEGMERHVGRAQAGLENELPRIVDAGGAIESRNPEELLEVMTLLTWAASTLEAAGRKPGHQHRDAVTRIAPVLRMLRHADGSLPRFHGGGPGEEGWLDRALAEAGSPEAWHDTLSMGYARLSFGRTSVIVDAAAPPKGPASRRAHASTLAFELTSGRRPLIVNVGSGEGFGHDMRREGRATPSHSTLDIDGTSSAQLGGGRGVRADEFRHVPEDVKVELSRPQAGSKFEGAHDGFVPGFGLTHARILELSYDGRDLAGEDMLLCLEKAHQKRFDRALDKKGLQGVPFRLHFHLHPDVEAKVDMAGHAVSLKLPSGEVWVFRHEGQRDLALQASIYLERDRIKPRPAQQIVLSGRVMQYATRIRWSFAKAQDTPLAMRDLIDVEDPLPSDMT